MSYSPEHKAKTRERILACARELFNSRGYHGVGIDSIMEAAGLTRGGFYAHFKSKDALFAAVLAEYPRMLSPELRRRMDGEGEPRSGWAGALVDSYLSEAHRKTVATGCSVPPLSADVNRGSRTARRVYTRNFRALTGAIARDLGGENETNRRAAMAAVALAIGGQTIARALDDPKLAAEFLETCRLAAREHLAKGG